jgi:uncharacterized delta-60 repeat protein
MRILATLLTALAPALLNAQPGSLDPLFSEDGIASTIFAYPVLRGLDAIVLQDDQRIVVGGNSQLSPGGYSNFAVARLLPTGQLDGSFGNGGKTVTQEVGDGNVCALAMQDDQKIIAGGTSTDGGYSRFTLARYLADGALDSSFGDDGLVFTAVGLYGGILRGLCIQPDGRIIAAGSALYEENRIVLARYTEGGVLDPSFGAGGTVVTNVVLNDEAQAITLQADGRILVSGACSNGGQGGIFVARFFTDGSPDDSFGGGGFVTTNINSVASAHAIAFQADGRITVTGNTFSNGNGDVCLVRFLPNGAFDTAFGSGGVVTTSFLTWTTGDDTGHGILVQPDGSIVVAATVDEPSQVANIGAVRYSPQGALDTGFGAAGLVNIDLLGNHGTAAGIARQADGKILIVGGLGSTCDTTVGVVVRLLGGPSGSAVGMAEQHNEDPALLYPDPVSENAILEFTLDHAEKSSARIADAAGRNVRVLFNDRLLAAGAHRLSVDLSGMAPGPHVLLLSQGTRQWPIRFVKE